MSSPGSTSGIPNPFTPLTDLSPDQRPARVWFRFFVSLLDRLNGNNPGGASQPQVLGASPLLFQAPRTGSLIIGAGASTVELSRDNGLTFLLIPGPPGIVPVLVGDLVRVSWAGPAPVVTFLPGSQ